MKYYKIHIISGSLCEQETYFPIRILVHVCAYTIICVYMCVCVCVCVCVYIQTHIHEHIHIYIIFVEIIKYLTCLTKNDTCAYKAEIQN